MIAAPFNRQTIENALHAWVSRATDLPVTWAAQNAPTPAVPYLTLAILSTAIVGSPDDETRFTDQIGDVLVTHAGTRRLIVSVNAYARVNDAEQSARAWMDKALGALVLAEFVDALRTAGIAIVSIGQVQSLDEIQTSEYTSRAQCDVTIAIAANLTETVPYIATIDVVAEAELGAPFTIQATE